MSIDFRVQNEGSIFLVEPVSQAAKTWTAEHVQLEGWQWFGPSFAVEHGYIGCLCEGIMADNLTIEGT